MYWVIAENKLSMTRNLYLTAKYDLPCLFTRTSVKTHFPSLGPSVNVSVRIISEEKYLSSTPAKSLVDLFQNAITQTCRMNRPIHNQLHNG